MSQSGLRDHKRRHEISKELNPNVKGHLLHHHQYFMNHPYLPHPMSCSHKILSDDHKTSSETSVPDIHHCRSCKQEFSKMSNYIAHRPCFFNNIPESELVLECGFCDAGQFHVFERLVEHYVIHFDAKIPKFSLEEELAMKLKKMGDRGDIIEKYLSSTVPPPNHKEGYEETCKKAEDNKLDLKKSNIPNIVCKIEKE